MRYVQIPVEVYNHHRFGRVDPLKDFLSENGLQPGEWESGKLMARLFYTGCPENHQDLSEAMEAVAEGMVDEFLEELRSDLLEEFQLR